ncbi:NADH-quinone oxidoreductase subunit L [Streptomyces albidoflavus]|uniref:NADH-quinone oxidoreductase subunit 5 family protein n=2 Tax=Streptomyces TaxID=1883 RepID=UPI000CD5C614|nr:MULTISPECIES: NADH-quinone oxidoreductase subunit L [Streptomyces]MCX4442322.1 NADH-quinone oxidoreductase subunit L [Streptomyces albidoflavus]WTB75892.1 NADH-quinone oxidoreductase subunit L [Streptomyces albidoflavus]WTC42158.1 NADH-quinone oxidoreductase subunit L [Streptomyces albidoflavus]WTD43421.1 NADH-quinone oxidoreductase subunit L [Streptomyces albidoflavus]WTD82308.1 NADH-quinone oxidoreductase subunit L [Streptomyces albidoflavus]
MTTTTLAVLVPVLPLLGALAGLALGRVAPGFVRPLAVLPPLAATVLAALVAARQHGGPAIDAATELTPTGSVPVELALHLDGFAVVVAVLVAAVATCVQLYSTGYLREDPRYPSYAALVSLFTSAMLLVVYSGDLIVLLVGWEVMGICSYFLVGHYWETTEARSASLKAFLVTKLGDVPFLIGLFALAADTGSFRITRILDAVGNGGLDHPTLIALLLLAGVAGKSAQFPLHIWLPDAMAGPTPVSALIHAATMVAAGVYFVARLLPVFAASAAALVVLAVMAAVTMAGSALAALAQDDIKRVLAYSTIGQLGYMTAALAVADRSAAVFHLLTHGAFKALLFLAAGALIHAAGTNSLTAMARTGALRTRAADAYWTMTVALLALAALPPFSGFFSKEAVLGAAERAATGHTEAAPAVAGWIVLTAGLATALLTAAYATRLWLRAFHGQGAERPVHGPQPLVMNVILWVLAAPSLALGLAYGVLGDWFGGASLAPTLTTSVLATGLALVGGLVTYGTWRHTTALAAARPRGPLEPQPESEAEMATEALTGHAPDDGDLAERPDPADPGRLLLGPLHRHAAAGFHLDAAARTLFVRPTLAAARLAAFLDREVVETYVRAGAAVPRLLGAAVRKSQTGNAQTYLTVLLAGALVLAVAAVLVTAAGA